MHNSTEDNGEPIVYHTEHATGSSDAQSHIRLCIPSHIINGCTHGMQPHATTGGNSEQQRTNRSV